MRKKKKKKNRTGWAISLVVVGNNLPGDINHTFIEVSELLEDCRGQVEVAVVALRALVRDGSSS